MILVEREDLQRVLNVLVNLQPIIANGLLTKQQLAFIDPSLDVAMEGLGRMLTLPDVKTATYDTRMSNDQLVALTKPSFLIYEDQRQDKKPDLPEVKGAFYDATYDLNNEADRYRLARDLKMTIDFKNRAITTPYGQTGLGIFHWGADSFYTTDAEAIVAAAAAVGRNGT